MLRRRGAHARGRDQAAGDGEGETVISVGSAKGELVGDVWWYAEQQAAGAGV